ncbi:hypothetical protein RB195_018709 [Necator americanus]|uniref:Uncharacterized protein n=1 Tax=Necator americanus TaxID=51031 RepID=A0ABR1CDR6_NECAM
MGSTPRRLSEEKWIDPPLRRLLNRTEPCTGTKPASASNPGGHFHETQPRTLLFTARLSRSISPIGSGRRLKAASQYQHACMDSSALDPASSTPGNFCRILACAQSVCSRGISSSRMCSL